ncbi:hypothetical protein CBR_g36290 [Chara braunii]|uniref:DNA (cytosine-5-)-methyltransferase n=1 Tax=Chara braunii TaxID=69332 RepID=A0A388LKA1_CHABU|nr:hypothetical protein CBR_g36290 [Chara braunii]|eukprot:GBG82760.1 hypothetical protein CBR_g36290 [Chara braunii]
MPALSLRGKGRGRVKALAVKPRSSTSGAAQKTGASRHGGRVVAGAKKQVKVGGASLKKGVAAASNGQKGHSSRPGESEGNGELTPPPNSASDVVEMGDDEKTRLDGENSECMQDSSPPKASAKSGSTGKKRNRDPEDFVFAMPPLSKEEARSKWPHRYLHETVKSGNRKKKEEPPTKRQKPAGNADLPELRDDACIAHYDCVEVDGELIRLGDAVHVKAEPGQPDFVAQVAEIFETDDGDGWFTARWFYRAHETTMGHVGNMFISPKRVFISNELMENPLRCITGKTNVVFWKSEWSWKGKLDLPLCDYYCDMAYNSAYSSFVDLKPESDSCEVTDKAQSGDDLVEIDETMFNNAVTPGNFEEALPGGSCNGSDNSCVIMQSPDQISSPAKMDNSSEQKAESRTVRSQPSGQVTSAQKSSGRKTKWRAVESGICSDADGRRTLALLDLYCGCGAMSTGLGYGVRSAGLKLETKWAVDLNREACESIRYNHPNTEVRNEDVGDFLGLLKAWEKLSEKYSESSPVEQKPEPVKQNEAKSAKKQSSGAKKGGKRRSARLTIEEDDSDTEPSDEEYEVEKVVDIRWAGSPDNHLEYKIRWVGYDEDEDTWETDDALENAQEKVREFILLSKAEKRLPLPGDVDVICGGPPCQGVSGFNRFRNYAAPLEDPKNQQMAVFMDVVEFLRPRYVLMENVVDILKFSSGFLGRYALTRLVDMHYQARLGVMVAGCYGVPQYRARVFIWGAIPSEVLPAYPLPTHDVVARGNTPANWEECVVAYTETEKVKLKDRLVLADAITDLPPVKNHERRDEMPYASDPKTEFQQLLRQPRPGSDDKVHSLLYDHRPLEMNDDDYARSCKIPRKKGANFRDLEGVETLPDGTCRLTKRVLLSSGKQLCPDYAITFVGGRSMKPFGRLWWDEIVATVVTRAEPHNQSVLHPAQDRVLTIRENARLQGFPDHYKLFGTVKARYMQVGNAVSVPLAAALGHSLGRSVQGITNGQPVMKLNTNPILYSRLVPLSAKGKGKQHR